MLPRRLCIALLVPLAAGCKKDEAPAADAAPAEGPQAVRERECERFATDMARTGLMAGQILVTALDDDPASADRGRAEMKAEAQQLRKELLDKCMQWPQEVMDCLPPLGVLEDGCEERLLAAMEGATPPPQEVTAGPALAWTFTLESDPRALSVAADGTVVVVAGVETNTLIALRDGAVAWRKEGDFRSWLRPRPDPSGTAPATWVVAEHDRLVAFDPSSGTERWSVRLPALVEGEGEWAEEREPEVKVAAWHGEALLVGDAEARFFRIDPAWCGAAMPGAKAKAGAEAGACIALDGRLPDEILDDDARLFVDDGGTRYLWEQGVLRGFSADWHPLMAARAHDSLSQVGLLGDRLVLIVDDDVVVLDPTQCRGEATFAPSGWPQPGALVVRGADECDECRAPPPGCRRWRTYLPDVTGEPPALLADGAVAVNAEGYTLALYDGDTRWKASTGGGGPLVTDGARLFGFSTELREGDPPGLFEVAAADGTLRWRTPLPVKVGDIYFSDDIRLALGGAWLAAAYEQTIVALPLPPA